MGDFFRRAADLYVDGFRNMTWGKPLWIIIVLKLIILFGVLRLFFFKPDLSGQTREQKIETVGSRLGAPAAEQPSGLPAKETETITN